MTMIQEKSDAESGGSNGCNKPDKRNRSSRSDNSGKWQNRRALKGMLS